MLIQLYLKLAQIHHCASTQKRWSFVKRVALFIGGSLIVVVHPFLENKANTSKGVILVKMKNAFEPVKRDHSVNTYSRISTVPRGSERSE